MSLRLSALGKQSLGNHQDTKPRNRAMSETVETSEKDFYGLELRVEKKFDHDM